MSIIPQQQQHDFYTNSLLLRNSTKDTHSRPLSPSNDSFFGLLASLSEKCG